MGDGARAVRRRRRALFAGLALPLVVACSSLQPPPGASPAGAVPAPAPPAVVAPTSGPTPSAVPPPGEPTRTPRPTRTPAPGEPSEPSEPPATPNPPQEHPNIVFLLTDDQTLAEMSSMPQTRAFGEQGVVFTQAISQYPLCCPARATLLTGQLPHNHGAMGNTLPWGGWRTLVDRDNLLPVWLQRAGYRTGIVGKYLNGYPSDGGPTYVPPGWTDWVVPVGGEYDYSTRLVNRNGVLERNRQYQSDFVADEVSKLIVTYAAEPEPFFIWGGFLAPHDGGPADPVESSPGPGRRGIRTPYVDPRYRGTEPRTLPDHPGVLEEDRSDKAGLVRRDRGLTRRDLGIQVQQRRESLRAVDDAIVRIGATLDLAGERQDTIVVFTSDNGYLLGEHGLNQKVLGYEPSIRVPLMMAGRGLPQGVVRDQLVGLTDLVPTFLAWAGATPGRVQDGVSLLPVIDDPGAGARRHLLLEAGGDPLEEVDRLYTGIRTGDGRVLLRYFDDWVETYDLRTDPHQLDGTTSRAEASWRGRLLAELDLLERCAGAACRGFVTG